MSPGWIYDCLIHEKRVSESLYAVHDSTHSISTESTSGKRDIDFRLCKDSLPRSTSIFYGSVSDAGYGRRGSGNSEYTERRTSQYKRRSSGFSFNIGNTKHLLDRLTGSQTLDSKYQYVSMDCRKFN